MTASPARSSSGSLAPRLSLWFPSLGTLRAASVEGALCPEPHSARLICASVHRPGHASSLQRGHFSPPVSLRLLSLLPHPGHAAVPAVQRGPVHSQGSGQGEEGPGQGAQAAHVSAQARSGDHSNHGCSGPGTHLPAVGFC